MEAWEVPSKEAWVEAEEVVGEAEVDPKENLNAEGSSLALQVPMVDPVDGVYRIHSSLHHLYIQICNLFFMVQSISLFLYSLKPEV